MSKSPVPRDLAARVLAEVLSSHGASTTSSLAADLAGKPPAGSAYSELVEWQTAQRRAPATPAADATGHRRLTPSEELQAAIDEGVRIALSKHGITGGQE